MTRLHARWGRDVRVVTVLVRQGHPGRGVRPYRSFEQKLRDARKHKHEDRIPWTVLADDVWGTVHRQYGMLASPAYLIGTDGRVAFYNAITHAPTLHRAIGDLLRQRGRGIAGRGIDRRPHVLPIVAGGWPGLRRGAPQSAVELELAMPSGAMLTWAGYQAQPILRPVALRGTPLPRAARVALGAALAAGGAAVWRASRQRARNSESESSAKLNAT